MLQYERAFEQELRPLRPFWKFWGVRLDPERDLFVIYIIHKSIYGMLIYIYIHMKNIVGSSSTVYVYVYDVLELFAI